MPMFSLLIPCTVLLLLACSDSKKDAAPRARLTQSDGFFEMRLLVTSKTTVTHGRITELRENTYIGAVSLVRGQRDIVLDARPSDPRRPSPARRRAGMRSPRTCWPASVKMSGPIWRSSRRGKLPSSIFFRA